MEGLELRWVGGYNSIYLLNGRALTGWRVIEPSQEATFYKVTKMGKAIDGFIDKDAAIAFCEATYTLEKRDG